MTDYHGTKYSRRNFIENSVKAVFVLGTGNILQSFAPGDFTLPGKDSLQIRFAIASDGHYGQEGTSFNEFHDDMIGWLNKESMGRGLDFTMINGDIVHDDSKLFPTVKTKFDQLRMPYYVSHGNHDKTDPETWEKIWKMPMHHSFEKGNAGFLILNTADDTGGYICPDLDWTSKHLELFKHKKHLFIFMHITPFKWTKNGIECNELTGMFKKQSNLRAIFHGHDHDQDNVKLSAGKPYFFDSHIGGNWGTEYRGYRIVEITKSGAILTYQMNPAMMKKVNANKVK